MKMNSKFNYSESESMVAKVEKIEKAIFDDNDTKEAWKTAVNKIYTEITKLVPEDENK